MSSTYKFKLPDVGEGVAEAEIVAWHVKVGDQVAEDQDLLDVMTDKATVEMPSPVAGTIVATHGHEGDIAAVGSVLVEISTDAPGAVQVDPDNASASSVKPEPVPEIRAPAAPDETASADPDIGRREAFAPKAAPAIATRPVGAEPLAAPATRARAYQLGIPLQFVPGSGPGGRITPDDLDAYISQTQSSGHRNANSQNVARKGIGETKIIGIRRKIAERMQDAKSRIPHISYIEECDLTALEALRKDLNESRQASQAKLTLLPFLVRAVVNLQPQFPHINARFEDTEDTLQTYEGVHVGIATQTPSGLMVPVLRHAETLDLWQCAAAIREITEAAREGRASRDELMGSTITLTSLGRLGGIASTPVINSPEVAIIAPNKLQERAVVRNGALQIRTMMNISASFDHRIVDGYDAADFIQSLKRLIEQPARLFMDGG